LGSLGPLRFDVQPATFSLCRSADGSTAWQGRPELRHSARDRDEGVHNQDLSGEDVYVLDFTPFREPGSYFISLPGVGRSFDFRIADHVYAEAFRASAHGVFIQRCGIALGPPYSDWRRIACHSDGLTRTTAPNLGHEQHWKDLPDFVDTDRPLIEAFGGHHDAGDYNPRSHIDVAQVLMDAYEMAPAKFTDGQLDIPEAGNGIPDIIDEADWALRLWTMLQDEDGGVPHGTESNGDPNFIQTAELDPLGDYAYAKDAEASFTFAGAMAQAARIRSALGRANESQDLLSRGLRAYEWGLAHDRSSQGAKDAWAYAAAQMLQTTREPVYGEHFRQACIWADDPNAPLDRYREYDQSRAAWAYVNCDLEAADLGLRSAVRRAILRQADEFVANAETMGYAFIKHPYAPINWGTGAYENFLYPVIWAWSLTGEERYLRWMVHTCDNTLGANPLNLSWIVDLGTKTIRAPLHNSRYGTSGEVAPGLQSEGPNQAADGYRVRESFHPSVDADLPPLYSFVDCHFAIAMDEGVVRAQANTMAAFGLLLPDAD
jgi:endoglucanase